MVHSKRAFCFVWSWSLFFKNKGIWR